MQLDSKFDWADVEDDVRLYALSLGISARKIPIDEHRLMRSLPVTVFPTKISRSLFYQASELQYSINRLIHRISLDYQFLEESLLRLPDEFVVKLFDIYRSVQKNGYAASHQLGFFRSDYMIDENNQLKQVEVNTISTSFCALSPQVTKLHRYTLRQYQGLKDDVIDEHIPVNDSLDQVSEAIVQAHQMYINAQCSAILFVVQELELNMMDHKIIEWNIKKLTNGSCQVFRRTFQQMDNGIISLGPNQELLLRINADTQKEISVVYFRSAYSTNCFKYENSWSLRLMIEQSRAIKCPSIQFQLAGFKQFQTLLSDRNIFDRYCKETNADDLFNSFTKFWPISNDSRYMVAKDPSKYVLKSNQEGGGNNIFGEQIITKLESIIEKNENEAYFLMQFIRQKPTDSFLILKEITPYEYYPIESELGIYGRILVESNNNNAIITNQSAGHLLRSKICGHNEVGIVSSAGILDSPFLI